MTNLVLMRIAPWPAARILAVLYLVIGIVVAPLMMIAALANPDSAPGGRAAGLVVAFLMPFIYAVIGFLFGAVGGALYNAVARLLGGIPLGFVAETPQALSSPASLLPDSGAGPLES
jgi:uncharacterized membrane protein